MHLYALDVPSRLVSIDEGALSYHHLRTCHLYDEVRFIEGDLLKFREKWKRFGCSIVCDGWSDARNRPIINIMVSCIYGSMFLKYVDTSGEVKTCEYIFEILKEAIKDSILNQALKVTTFVTMRPSILALFRKHSSKDLLKPAQTRFAYMFIMLSNLLDERVYNGMRSMVVSVEYTRKKVCQTRKAKDVSGIVLSAFFWRSAREIVSICAPILKEVKSLCVKRWDMMHSPLHAAAYVLHPIWREKCPDDDGEVSDGWMDVLKRYTHGDLEKQGILMDELDKYKSIEGTYQRPLARDEKRMHYALRNKLLPKNTEKLVYIHTNLRLATKIKERGFEKIEVTLDTIEHEKDDDRLLTLQKSKEGEGMLDSTTPILERLTLRDDNPLFAHDDDDDDDDDDPPHGNDDVGEEDIQLDDD
ncbi:hypothetical protein KP509_25G022600 [Ceratopteris richardii]|uniref:DUF659 domain-containing protein n=1 Tax=Ceratopteris richardii TaxID=49495 RepID=A0A8T2RNC6_CERRI|nr:hypothetical protein KP509_25G022600 [Ceratopteris richardii]